MSKAFPASELIYKLQNLPVRVLWSKAYEGTQNSLFDVFYSFCKLGNSFISIHGEMHIETFHKRRQGVSTKVAKAYRCEYELTENGLNQISKEYIGLGADPRFVSDGNNAYAYVIGYGEAKHPAFLYVAKDNSLHPLVADDDFDWGKNWQPFLKDGSLFVVHELNPYSVYKIDLETFRLEKCFSIDSDFAFPAHYTNFTMFRGGANAICEDDHVVGIGRASAQPYRHLPFIWSSYKNQAPIIQFFDFFNQFSNKGFSIADPTCFFKDDNTVFLGLACSETLWFFQQQFLNLLLVVDEDDKYSNLPLLSDYLSSFEDTHIDQSVNLENHIFYCDRMQHNIPYSNEFGVKSTGLPGVLVYGPYIELCKEMKLSVELTYLTMDMQNTEAGVFDIYLSKELENGEVEFLKVTECSLNSTDKEIGTATLYIDTADYLGYKVEFRVHVNEGHELNAFHIRTRKCQKTIQQ